MSFFHSDRVPAVIPTSKSELVHKCLTLIP